MKIASITAVLESLAPISTQESYDNSGLLTGNKNWELTNALISLDCTEAVVEEAIQKKCNLIIAHHPILFKGLKKLTGSNYVERTIIKAIQNNIAIYAIHTNLDNYQFGVNKKIGEIIGIKNNQILRPTLNQLVKLIVYVPSEHRQVVLNALFQSGAGTIGQYSDCSYTSEGLGTFKASDKANPFVGVKGERHIEKESRIEVIVNNALIDQVVTSLITAHPYEEVAYDLIPLLNENKFSGAGMFGELDTEMSSTEFLNLLKEKFNLKIIRHTALLAKPIKKIAWCGGSGSFLLEDAKKSGADVFITSDFKYHEFFDADNQIIIADIGHFESEQFTIDLLGELLQKKIPNFAPCLVETKTNPIKYF